jgi:hypothetical protein
MSTAAKVSELLVALKQLFSTDVDDYFAAPRNFPDLPDSPNFSELKSTYERLRSLYKPLTTDPTILLQLPFQNVTNLHGVAQGAANAFPNLRTSSDANVFRGFAQQLDGFALQTHVVGLEYLVSGGASIEAVRQSLSNDQQTLQNGLVTLQKNNNDVETLKKQIQNLITPAVAGSLSKSFTERRDSLAKFRYLWLYIAGVIVAGAGLGFYYLGKDLATALGAGGGGQNVWAVVGLRFLFLVPVFVLLGFALTQYRKERNFEEGYAHKAAVSVTLPNYGDLLPSGPVREQIVTAAANVIFSSPIGQRAEPETTGDAIAGAKELVEAASKLMPWWKK